MPIRFRCPKCDQLLGISRRKAGAHVRCPSCRYEVAVPAEDEPPRAEPVAGPPPVVPPAAGPALFERDDFDDLLNRSVVGSGGGPVEKPRSHGSAVRTPVPAARAQPVPPPPVIQPAAPWVPAIEALPAGGLVLSPARATVLTVVVILLLALAFALGLIVGRFVL